MLQSSGIIIVEDEPLIAMMVEQMAADLGYQVQGCAGTEDDALELLEATAPAAAILDIKLGSQTCLSVATRCRERGIPVIFTSGLPAVDADVFANGEPVLNKPFSFEDFRDVLHHVLGSVAPTGSVPSTRKPQ
jgi:DNA-binding response OmpR family regulator